MLIVNTHSYSCACMYIQQLYTYACIYVYSFNGICYSRHTKILRLLCNLRAYFSAQERVQRHSQKTISLISKERFSFVGLFHYTKTNKRKEHSLFCFCTRFFNVEEEKMLKEQSSYFLFIYLFLLVMQYFGETHIQVTDHQNKQIY